MMETQHNEICEWHKKLKWELFLRYWLAQDVRVDIWAGIDRKKSENNYLLKSLGYGVIVTSENYPYILNPFS